MPPILLPCYNCWPPAHSYRQHLRKAQLRVTRWHCLSTAATFVLPTRGRGSHDLLIMFAVSPELSHLFCSTRCPLKSDSDILPVVPSLQLPQLTVLPLQLLMIALLFQDVPDHVLCAVKCLYLTQLQLPPLAVPLRLCQLPCHVSKAGSGVFEIRGLLVQLPQPLPPFHELVFCLSHHTADVIAPAYKETETQSSVKVRGNLSHSKHVPLGPELALRQ